MCVGGQVPKSHEAKALKIRKRVAGYCAGCGEDRNCGGVKAEEVGFPYVE